MDLNFDTIFELFLGVILILYGFGKIQASKDPEKNATWLAKYGIILKIGGFVMLIIGAIRITGILS